MGMYLQSRTFAINRGLSFRIEPPCSKEIDSIISWLPQTFTRQNSLMHGKINKTSQSYLDACTCNGNGALSHQCLQGWPHFATLWHKEIRTALSNWASFSGKPNITKGTATIHLRCGDILDPAVIVSGGGGGYGFLKSSLYVKHLLGRNVTKIDLVTTSIVGCGYSTDGRPSDCKHGPECFRIVHALVQSLSDSIGLSKDHFHIHDKESILWSMHHIAFSDISFCSISTFCYFASLGSNHVIHSSIGSLVPSVEKILPDLLSGFEVDEGDNFITMKELLAANESGLVESVIEWTKQ